MKNSMSLVLILVILSGTLGCNKKSQTNSESQRPSDRMQIASSGDSSSTDTIDLNDAIGKEAPEIKLEAAFFGPPADEISLASLRGKVVVLDYWATW